MSLKRNLGWVLLAGAAAAVGAHFGTQARAIADYWYAIDANSLVGLQALVEQRLDPDPDDPTLYFDVVLPLLELSLWLVVACIAALAGVLALILPRLRRRRRRFE